MFVLFIKFDKVGKEFVRVVFSKVLGFGLFFDYEDEDEEEEEGGGGEGKRGDVSK